MAQTPSKRVSQGDNIDYTPSTAVTAGDVVVVGTMVCVAPLDIPANTLGAVAYAGVFLCPKDTSAPAIGVAIYWNATGSPVGGTAGSGCATTTSAGGTLMGTTVGAALTGDAAVLVRLAG